MTAALWILAAQLLAMAVVLPVLRTGKEADRL